MGVLEGLVEFDPTSSMKLLITTIFSTVTVLCKGTAYTEGWVAKTTARLNDATQNPLPPSVDVNFLENLAGFINRDRLGTEHVKLGLKMLYMTAQDPIYRPIAWSIEQARMSNVTSALALAECMAKVPFLPLDVLISMGVPWEQFKSFAQVALCLLVDPFYSIVAAEQAVRTYADIAYVADALKSSVLNDKTFKRGFRGDPQKSVTLPASTLQEIADVIAAINQSAMEDVFSIAQVFEARLSKKLITTRNATYIDLSGAEQEAQATFSEVYISGRRLTVPPEPILEGEDAVNRGLPPGTRAALVSTPTLIKLIKESAPDNYNHVVRIGKALYAQTEQRKLSTHVDDGELTPYWNEYLSDEVRESANALGLDIPDVEETQYELVGTPGRWDYLRFHIPGRVAADSDIAEKNVWPWGYPPKEDDNLDDEDRGNKPKGGKTGKKGKGEKSTPHPSPRPRNTEPESEAVTEPEELSKRRPEGDAGGSGIKPTSTGTRTTESHTPKTGQTSDVKTPATGLSEYLVGPVNVRTSQGGNTIRLTAGATGAWNMVDHFRLLGVLENLCSSIEASSDNDKVLAMRERVTVEVESGYKQYKLQDTVQEIASAHAIILCTHPTRDGFWKSTPTFHVSWLKTAPALVGSFPHSTPLVWRRPDVVLNDIKGGADEYWQGHALLTESEYHTRTNYVLTATGRIKISGDLLKSLTLLHINTTGDFPEYLWPFFYQAKPSNKSQFVKLSTAVAFAGYQNVDVRFWFWLEDSVIDEIMSPTDVAEQLETLRRIMAIPSLVNQFNQKALGVSIHEIPSR
ncbi:nucleocapsid protein [Hancheng leafhopper mivirus]|uniref:nucleocapsid protein n=1 Tax=Hancheng leafhopper mivirus TaxID=2714894 RepID=UPI002481DF4C|nr:nucleocapsid protein [Hancheng leafhopper mivirus]QIH31160.1 nucleocapsid protein [Hancheng leafhopper mivirus]